MVEGTRIVGGRYSLEERIGAGGMGVVWRAQDLRLGRVVAVKELLLRGVGDAAAASEAKRRAIREARIAARLNHPNAVSIFDVVEDSDQPWLVMEYVPSQDLTAVLAERGSLPPAEVATIGGQLASALAAAHAAGIVHRDIKPGNVLVTDNGTVKITDFGISRAVGDATITVASVISGTPAYLAPEVAKGGDADHASDVFSLGATLYSAVEGAPPFGTDANLIALLYRVAGGVPKPPTRAGILTPVLLDMLHRDPAARPTMARAAERLTALTSGPPEPEPKAPPRRTAILPVLPRPAKPKAQVKAQAKPKTPPAAKPATAKAPPPAPTRQAPPAPKPTAPPRSRRTPFFLAAAVALIAAAGIVFYLANRGTTPTDPRADPSWSSSATRPTPSNAAAAPSTAPSRSPETVVVTPQKAIADYYALLPTNTQAGYARLSDRFKQEHASSFADYQSFWGGIGAVTATEVTPGGDGTVTATITYTLAGGGTSTERHVYGLVQVNGQWVIDSQRMA